MAGASPLVGREAEAAELAACAAAAAEGHGGLVLLAGEAGVGKTRLAQELAGTCGLASLAGSAPQEGCPPYGPIVAALRAHLRREPEALGARGALTPFLAVLLPELGDAADSADAATLAEALCAALQAIARSGPALVFLDDLHWADHATLETLAVLATALTDEPCLLVGAYRSDEIPRGHALRQLRRGLRRAGGLRELVIAPLDESGTAALAGELLGRAPDSDLRAALYARTQGIPFFVEELVTALVASRRLELRPEGASIVADDAAPAIPDSLRDAIGLRLARLSDAARETLEVAAVAGVSVDLDLLLELGSEEGVDEAIRHGILLDVGAGRAVFRHALTREAVYADVPWTRRRKLHRLLAERIELRDPLPLVAAEHWLAAREFGRGCRALAAAAAAFAAAHAYRDALAAGRRAAEIWADGVDEEQRLTLIARIAAWAQLAGQFTAAAAASRELADRHRLAGDSAGVARAERQLAIAYELQGASEPALAARQAAAVEFRRSGRLGDAADDLLAAAAHLDSAGSVAAALQLADLALTDARQAGRRDLEVRALGIHGTASAKLGDLERGLGVARQALELALVDDLAAPAAEAYQRLANALEQVGDYAAAWDAYQAGYEFCEARDQDGAANVCLVCLGAILVFTGEWDRALRLDRRILAASQAPLGARMGAKQHIGLIGAARGETRRARALLLESGAYAARFERERMEIWDALGHGWLDELEDSPAAALDRCRSILARWGESESVHYPAPALRWAATYCATHGAEAEARACAAALARLAERTVNPESVAALTHALGEVALLDGDAAQATGRFLQALTVLEPLHLPYETAQTSLRAGLALVQAGERERGIEKLADAHLIARKLRARPFADRAARELVAIGEPVERRLGRRAAERLEGPGLTRRELEIVRLVGEGLTNRDIARRLFVSTRTVDMHVRNVLRKLDSRSRAEATRKASALGLLP